MTDVRHGCGIAGSGVAPAGCPTYWLGLTLADGEVGSFLIRWDPWDGLTQDNPDFWARYAKRYSGAGPHRTGVVNRKGWGRPGDGPGDHVVADFIVQELFSHPSNPLGVKDRSLWDGTPSDRDREDIMACGIYPQLRKMHTVLFGEDTNGHGPTAPAGLGGLAASIQPAAPGAPVPDLAALFMSPGAPPDGSTFSVGGFSPTVGTSAPTVSPADLAAFRRVAATLTLADLLRILAGSPALRGPIGGGAA